MLKYLKILLFTCLTLFAYGQEAELPHQDELLTGITVDLREPCYVDGVLTTDKGGVITGPDLRIQALKLCYTRKVVDQIPHVTVEAEGDLIIEFGEYTFVGSRLVYDFQKKEGTLYQGKTGSPPWYFGGEVIEFRPDNSYLIYNGYVTTSENAEPEWDIAASKLSIGADRSVLAEKVELRFAQYPVLWIPSLKTNLKSVFDSPIRYRFRWGGRQGPRVGLTYEVLSWQQWKTFLRFDYRLTRGPGAGFELYYHSLDYKTHFQSINYVAKDSSLLNSHEKMRYRFEGNFYKLMDGDKLKILLTYDKISDSDMPGSYCDRDFDFKTSERTEFLVRRQEEDWISHFYTRLRVNNFQTVKQELPSFTTHFRPFYLGQTGILSENWAQVAYLNYKYSHHLPHVKNFSSTRMEYRPRLYRPFSLGPMTLTPELGGVAIFYGNSKDKKPQWLLVGIVGTNLYTQLYRFYCQNQVKHIIEPYLSYHYYSAPTSSPCQHFIFDITDGWTRLNQLTFGVKNRFYQKLADGSVWQWLYTNVYAHTFFNQRHLHPFIPKLYGDFIFFPLSTLRYRLQAAWDVKHQQLAHFNFLTEWTWNANLAMAIELRHRNAFDWRKVDHNNFFLDAFHSEKTLHHSSLSDRRNTLLMHLFYRFHPNWACEVSVRHGWNRCREPAYTEYEIDLMTTIQTAWHLKFSFQRQQKDTRVAVYVNMGLKAPNQVDENHTISYYD